MSDHDHDMPAREAAIIVALYQAARTDLFSASLALQTEIALTFKHICWGVPHQAVSPAAVNLCFLYPCGINCYLKSPGLILLPCMASVQCAAAVTIVF